jgi:hypothetical protein
MIHSRYRWLPFLLFGFAFSSEPAEAQHYLAVRDAAKVAISFSEVYTMQEGVEYRVVGVSEGGGLSIQTPAGVADYKGDRVRVLSGGAFSLGTIATKNVESKTDGSSATWSGSLVSPQSLAQVYAAFQWYVDGQPVKTSFKRIGVLEANKPYSVFFSLPIVGEGSFSVHFWSGPGELKQQKGW